MREAPRPDRQTQLFMAACALTGLAALVLRAYLSFGAPDVIEWDETYYTSTTATTAAGIGRYPFVLGYPQIPGMGGIGFVIYLYVAAYNLFGPALLSLRLVSFIASLAGVAGSAALTGRLFGRNAAAAAFALTPSLLVFHGINSIRLDAMAFAFVACGLVAYSWLDEGEPAAWRSALVGALFGLGLNIHLHTAAAAFAVGVAYLRKPGFFRCPVPYAAGYMAAAALFLGITVLPGPASYVRTAALARLSAVDSDTSLNLTAPLNRAKLAASFLSPTEVIPKEIARHTSMFGGMPWWERTLWLLGVPMFLLSGPMNARYRARWLLPGALLGAGIVLNSSAPVYFAPLLPFFVPAMATLISQGFRRTDGMQASATTPISLALALVFCGAISYTVVGRTRDAAIVVQTTQNMPMPAAVRYITNSVSTGCTLAGPTALYARYFMAYPRFVGTRSTEILIGSTYLDLQNDLGAYWRVKAPDVVFGEIDGALADYVVADNYERLADYIWKRRELSKTCQLQLER